MRLFLCLIVAAITVALITATVFLFVKKNGRWKILASIALLWFIGASGGLLSVSTNPSIWVDPPNALDERFVVEVRHFRNYATGTKYVFQVCLSEERFFERVQAQYPEATQKNGIIIIDYYGNQYEIVLLKSYGLMKTYQLAYINSSS
jgi:hypothetical protein